MTSLLLLRCKGCASPIEPGAGAALSGPLLLDLCCGRCGKRALYQVRRDTAAGN